MKASWLLAVAGLALGGSTASADYRKVWGQQVDRTPNDFPSQSFLDAKGNLVVAGTVGTTIYFGDTTNILVYCISNKGVLKWSRVIDGPGHKVDTATCVEVDSLGNVVVGGVTTGTGNPAPTWATIIKLNGVNGATLWTRYYKGLAATRRSNAVYDLEIGPNNEVFWTGYGQSLNNATGSDIVFEKVLTTGSVAFSKQIPGTGNQFDTGRFVRTNRNRYREAGYPVYVAVEVKMVHTNMSLSQDIGLLLFDSGTGTPSAVKKVNAPVAGIYNQVADLCIGSNGTIHLPFLTNMTAFDTGLAIARIDDNPFGTIMNTWKYGAGNGLQERWGDIVVDPTGDVFGIFNIFKQGSQESAGRLARIDRSTFKANLIAPFGVVGHHVEVHDLSLGDDGMLYFGQQDQTHSTSTLRVVSRSGLVPSPQPPSPQPGFPGYVEEIWPRVGGGVIAVGTTNEGGNWQADQEEVKADLTVEPVPPNKPEVHRGGVLKMRVVLAKAAAADTKITLKCTGGSTVPASVTIKKGATTATFDFKGGSKIEWSDVEAKGGGFKSNCCVSVD